jgi:hypothetical protein
MKFTIPLLVLALMVLAYAGNTRPERAANIAAAPWVVAQPAPGGRP